MSEQLTIRVLRGGADAGREVALVTFTNHGITTCSMFGFPGVSLRRNQVLLGMPATRSRTKAHTVKLAPGESAEAQLTDFSSCQAALSDAVRVYAPNVKVFVDRPLELRGCHIEIEPVTHS